MSYDDVRHKEFAVNQPVIVRGVEGLHEIYKDRLNPRGTPRHHAKLLKEFGVTKVIALRSPDALAGYAGLFDSKMIRGEAKDCGVEILLIDKPDVGLAWLNFGNARWLLTSRSGDSDYYFPEHLGLFLMQPPGLAEFLTDHFITGFQRLNEDQQTPLKRLAEEVPAFAKAILKGVPSNDFQDLEEEAARPPTSTAVAVVPEQPFRPPEAGKLVAMVGGARPVSSLDQASAATKRGGIKVVTVGGKPVAPG